MYKERLVGVGDPPVVRSRRTIIFIILRPVRQVVPPNTFRLSDHLRVEQADDGMVLQAREEVGRGKRYGMDGEVEMTDKEAERFAKWVFAHDLESE